MPALIQLSVSAWQPPPRAQRFSACPDLFVSIQPELNLLPAIPIHYKNNIRYQFMYIQCYDRYNSLVFHLYIPCWSPWSTMSNASEVPLSPCSLSVEDPLLVVLGLPPLPAHDLSPPDASPGPQYAGASSFPPPIRISSRVVPMMMGYHPLLLQDVLCLS